MYVLFIARYLEKARIYAVLITVLHKIKFNAYGISSVT